MLIDCANAINDRPVGVRLLTKEGNLPVTVNQLLLGRRSTIERDSSLVPEESLEENGLSRRMMYVSEGARDGVVESIPQ